MAIAEGVSLSQIDQQIQTGVSQELRAEVKPVQKAVAKELKRPHSRPEITDDIRRKAEVNDLATQEGTLMSQVENKLGINDTGKSLDERASVAIPQWRKVLTGHLATLKGLGEVIGRGNFDVVDQLEPIQTKIEDAKKQLARWQAKLAELRGNLPDSSLESTERPLRDSIIEQRARELATAQALVDLLQQGQSIKWEDINTADPKTVAGALAQRPPLPREGRIGAQVLYRRIREIRTARHGTTTQLGEALYKRYGEESGINFPQMRREQEAENGREQNLSAEVRQSLRGVNDIRQQGVLELRKYVADRHLTGEPLADFLKRMGVNKLPPEGDAVDSGDEPQTAEEELNPEDYFAPESPYDQLITARARVADYDRAFVEAMKAATKNPLDASQALQVDLLRSIAHSVLGIVEGNVSVIYAASNERQINEAQSAVDAAQAQQRKLDNQAKRALLLPTLRKWSSRAGLMVTGPLILLGKLAEHVQSGSNMYVDRKYAEAKSTIKAKLNPATTAAQEELTAAEQLLRFANGRSDRINDDQSAQEAAA